jgi:hypothetical protein
MRDFVGVIPGATVVDVRVCDINRECTAVEVLEGLMLLRREISKSGRPARYISRLLPLPFKLLKRHVLIVLIDEANFVLDYRDSKCDSGCCGQSSSKWRYHYRLSCCGVRLP